MKQALYRKYRSKSFKEVVGQEHVTKTLERAIKSDRISHAYLFTGPRGVGKTSVARILAHVVNGLPYEGEAVHLDIIEIDAASNRRIDEIRDLREKVRTAPVAGKYKVYIIDEVHMLTREAFNALLKTLEEPPAHIIFILATTEAHKLPDTIVSRTQRFEFKPVSATKIQTHLADIAKSEGVSISPEALKLLAEFGGGSFRDSIGYLDQLSSGDTKISEEEVRVVLGLPSAQQVTSLLQFVKDNNPQEILEGVQILKNQGIDASAAAASLSREIREEIQAGGSSVNYISLLKRLIEVPSSSRPYEYLEICLLEACESHSSSKTVPARIKTTVADSQSIHLVNHVASRAPDKPSRLSDFDISLWPEVVNSAKEKAASIYTALRLAEPSFAEEKLTLKFQFPLHQKKIEQAKNKALVSELIESLTGAKIRVACEVDKSAFSKETPEPMEKIITKTSPIHSINNVFGSAEVL